jgi:hypothetical protein
VALIAGDRPDLTCAVMERVPFDVGVVFKLENAADIQFVESRFRVEQTRPSSRSRPSIPPAAADRRLTRRRRTTISAPVITPPRKDGR